MSLLREVYALLAGRSGQEFMRDLGLPGVKMVPGPGALVLEADAGFWVDIGHVLLLVNVGVVVLAAEELSRRGREPSQEHLAVATLAVASGLVRVLPVPREASP